ncbi:MAG: glucose-1-phosphate adenylyltransferase [Gammaproteobacteria bacterium]|nr:glucose-1-phosphate adenylyltransferase [Gammaproteobacteria bacterium]MBT8149753.1 glucose-1-phosphate adenylyltransferase [Gammaproteobacteria bacterium]NND39017.1 glucose-1-phosphate adenylyltransferase [Pseudomonadales bacterium]NNM10486.1 glucose-1-phosphate adenylyltransferase [Pseudomonadales bacterium]RZV52249.1 MAG: glucose-1-phosphate adenylyltransferase [Pseudomonadales bacterium]
MVSSNKNTKAAADSSDTVNADNPRYVSRLTKDTLALVLAGGRGSRLYELTNWRAKPALYFGGKFRIIDFPLSNCINSGIRKVGVLTQYKAHSLIRHIVSGWSHFKKELNEFVDILPASQRFSDDWYQGTADAIYQNIDIIRAEAPKYVMVLSGDHIYRMDYGSMLVRHVESGADMTVSCLEVPIEEAAGAFGVMQVDSESRVLGFEEKPEHPRPIPGQEDLTLASMGNYIFNTDFLFEQLAKDAMDPKSSHDFGNDVIPAIVDTRRVFAYPFRDPATSERAYWRDVGTLDSFWEANMELVEPVPALNLYDPDWPIWTYQSQYPPAKFVFDSDDRRGMAVDSTVSGGCIISGATIRKSLIYSNVHVGDCSYIEQSLVLPDVRIGKNCKVHKAIIDRKCTLPDGIEIGVNHEQDRANGFRVTEKGVVLVTRGMLGQPEGYA